VKSQLDIIEQRILNLEYQHLKKKYPPRGSIYTSVPKPGTNQWTLETIVKNGKKVYELRDSSGTRRTLPANPKLWPTDVQEAKGKIEEIDKARRQGGHYIGITDFPVTCV
jgi:hypothetical protein